MAYEAGWAMGRMGIAQGWEWQPDEGRGSVRRRTFSDAGDGEVLVTVCLLESVENILIRPIGEQLLDERGLASVLLLQLAQLALILQHSRIVGVLVVELIAVGSAWSSTAPAGKSASSAATRTSAARGGSPGLYLRHCWVCSLWEGRVFHVWKIGRSQLRPADIDTTALVGGEVVLRNSDRWDGQRKKRKRKGAAKWERKTTTS